MSLPTSYVGHPDRYKTHGTCPPRSAVATGAAWGALTAGAAPEPKLQAAASNAGAAKSAARWVFTSPVRPEFGQGNNELREGSSRERFTCPRPRLLPVIASL